jgi:hypothetical protein
MIKRKLKSRGFRMDFTHGFLSDVPKKRRKFKGRWNGDPNSVYVPPRPAWYDMVGKFSDYI